MQNLPVLLLIIPMLGAIFTFVFGKLNDKLAFWSAEIISFVLFVISVILFLNFENPIDIPMEWFSFGNFSIPFGIYIDNLSLIMLLIATGLGFLDVHFAHDYMKDEKDKARYFSKVLFFIGGMILLVSAKDMVALFVGWEFMGVASYFLISFWHQNKAPADAGMSAFLFTKFGDIFLFLAIGLLFYLGGTLDMVLLNEKALNSEIDKDYIYLISIFIFIASIGKSGQFPLFPWLMRAMEGPTTVSALIHGATMVNSGIYIVARLFDFYMVGEALIVVATFGAISAFIGATSALVQSEIKKVLAYSTMSHLSLAFIGLGAGSLSAGVGHLINHSIFKALLFLSAGAIIMSSSHIKDMWRYGGYSKKMLGVSVVMGIGALSLAGIFPFSGFYSKDAVIVQTLINPQTSGLIASLTIISGVLSIAYIGRVWFLTFLGKSRDEEIYKNIKTPSFFWIVLPLSIMAFLTFALGFVQDDIAYMVTGIKETHHESGMLVYMILGSIALVGFIVYTYYVKKLELVQKVSSQPLMKIIHKVLLNGYFVEFFIHYISKEVVVNSISKGINKIDTNLIDNIVNSVVTLSKKIYNYFTKTQTSYIGDALGVMVVSLFVMIVMFFIGGIV